MNDTDREIMLIAAAIAGFAVSFTCWAAWLARKTRLARSHRTRSQRSG